ncbi:MULTISPECIES: DUF4229 domain-containing protein [unclassified Crossiella]|uniref:DUF4229 domain-containing protein n=1 Tax=unclassified Crossiella TaxID=2620835 RepID=UPI001FFF0203|nr:MULTISPECIES: DUF4229 domain-containing protein [unclassified Crossiella]MCK2236751.1 DUF4229 domain-containing protein [Crossiella sp. S99.2]MCK2250419.1 DUF4229 domain-containing protein [Crossiella sp. S99.1]
MEVTDTPDTNGTLNRDLALYTVARLGLVVLFAAILAAVGVPLLVAMAVAFVTALPLSFVLFAGLRQRVARGLAARGEQRKDERARLRAQLRGEG